MVEISSIISSIKSGDYNHAALGIKPASFREGGPFLEPVGKPGATSVVFEAESRDGSRRAIRFPKGVLPGEEHWRRMRALSGLVADEAKAPGSSGAPFPITPFEVVDKAAKVEGVWIPAITMPYLEASPMGEAIKENYRSGDKVGLRALSNGIARLGKFFQRSNWDHGDISPGNLLVRDGGLYLIDPDTLRHSSLADSPVTELGHPSCAHPRRSGAELEDDLYKFPLHTLLMTVDYLASCEEGRHDFKDEDCILLSSEDLSNPRASDIMRGMGDHPTLAARVDSLIAACEARDVEVANSLLPEFHRPKPVPRGAGIMPPPRGIGGFVAASLTRGNAYVRQERPLRVPLGMKSSEPTKDTIVSLTEEQIRDGGKYKTALVGLRVSKKIGESVGQAAKNLGFKGYVSLLRDSRLGLQFEQIGDDPYNILRLAHA